MTDDFDGLIAAAVAAPFAGWDFSWIAGRQTVAGKPWDFGAIVRRAARHVGVVVDLGTGGGEWLAALRLENAVVIATECWQPNLSVAAERLRPLGVSVVTHREAPDNVDWQATGGELPFRAGRVDLIVNRHESYSPSEIRSALAPTGAFVTQQVGDCDLLELLEDLGARSPEIGWHLDAATDQLARNGLRVVESDEARFTMRFRDVGALAYYVRAMPWAFPGFDLARDVARLRDVHARIERDGCYETLAHRFWLRAVHA